MLAKLLVFYILLYCIVGDFISAVFGFEHARLICLIGIVTTLPIYYVQKKDKNIIFITTIVIFLMISFIIVNGRSDRLSFFYTILLGYLLFSEKKVALKYLDYVFVIQFVLIFIEVVFGKHIYLEVYTGIINPTILDNSNALELFDETGFRPKGLFPGTLTGCSFVIFYSILNKESKIRVLWAVLMALLMNGRLAILLTSAVATLYFIKNRQTKKFNFQKFIKVLLGGLSFIIVAYSFNQGIRDRVDRILSSFIFDERSNNLGRAMIYVAAFNTYIEQYDYKSKFFGGEYEILDAYGRPLAAESDTIGMLLEIGIMGSLIYWGALFIMFRCKSDDEFIPIWYVVLLTFLAWIEYRHLTGNMRGALFWMLYYSYSNINIAKLKGQKQL